LLRGQILFPCNAGAVHTWHITDYSLRCSNSAAIGDNRTFETNRRLQSVGSRIACEDDQGVYALLRGYAANALMLLDLPAAWVPPCLLMVSYVNTSQKFSQIATAVAS
jgi:hypothetical protein